METTVYMGLFPVTDWRAVFMDLLDMVHTGQ